MSQITVELLDKLCKKYGDASDYRVSKELNITRAAVSRYRTGKSAMNDDIAVRAAELVGENPAYVLAALQAERTPSAEAKKVYRKIAAEFAGKAASILIALLLFKAEAIPAASTTYSKSQVATIEIMSIIRAWLRKHCRPPIFRFVTSAVA